MFCKNCYKFNMTNNCIYCGFHNDGTPVKKEPKQKDVVDGEVENVVVDDLPERTFVEIGSKANKLKTLNIATLAVLGVSVLLSLISFFRFRGMVMGLGAISMFGPILYSLAAAVPCVLYLASSKYREKYAEKKHMTITIVCLVIAVSLIFNALMTSVNIRRFMRF